jgi:hypothetical protein
VGRSRQGNAFEITRVKVNATADLYHLEKDWAWRRAEVLAHEFATSRLPKNIDATIARVFREEADNRQRQAVRLEREANGIRKPGQGVFG